MKQKTMIILVTALLLLMLSALACAQAETEHGLILPKSVRIIEEMAFEGTAASEVHMSEGVERIESRAFAEMPYLEKVEIPKSTRYIAEDTFSGNESIRMGVVPGSFAEKWAKKHGFSHYYTVFCIPGLNTYILGCLLICLFASYAEMLEDLIRKVKARSSAEKEKHVAPKDRPESYPLELVFP